MRDVSPAQGGGFCFAPKCGAGGASAELLLARSLSTCLLLMTLAAISRAPWSQACQDQPLGLSHPTDLLGTTPPHGACPQRASSEQTRAVPASVPGLGDHTPLRGQEKSCLVWELIDQKGWAASLLQRPPDGFMAVHWALPAAPAPPDCFPHSSASTDAGGIWDRPSEALICPADVRENWSSLEGG